MPGMTAYAGLAEIGKPKEGETVVVAAGTGAVGAMVETIAKIRGARVVGVAGGAAKCRYATEELGFDACVDHRGPSIDARLKAACPNGINVYWENVGGPIFEAVFPLLNFFARIPVCGLISLYNSTELPSGGLGAAQTLRATLTKRLNIRGFIVSDFAALEGEFLREMSAWLREGRIKYREHVIEGLENAPRGLIGLLRGGELWQDGRARRGRGRHAVAASRPRRPRVGRR